MTMRLGLLVGLASTSMALLPPAERPSQTALWMGKGLNKSRNKQADLQRKLALAKQQNGKTVTPSDDSSKLTDDVMKEQNDRKRFQELLDRSSSKVLNDFSADGYLNQQQEEKEIDAMRAGLDRIFEGDPAPTDCFQDLVHIQSEQAIGRTGMEKLVPWMGKASEYLVVLCDPRVESNELRESAQLLAIELPASLLANLIVVTADSPAENRRWLKKSGSMRVPVYADEKLSWMRAYTALGDDRWSMSVFIIAEKRVQKLAREVDVYSVTRTVTNAVKSMQQLRL